MIGTSQPALSHDTPGNRRRFAWLPIPVLVAAITALWSADIRTVWTEPFLYWFIQIGSAVLGVALIVIPAARGFAVSGQPSLLMLGCGVLMSQIGAFAMPFAPMQNLNTGFAIYNTSVLFSALCHFIGAAVTSRRTLPLKHPALWLHVVYTAGAALMGLVILAAFTGQTPVFFIDGHGGTALRAFVISISSTLFILTAGLFWRINRRTASPFFYWYSLGLVLLAAGLAGSMLITVKDTPLQWATRSTQVLGLVYMCVAVLASLRQTGVWRIPGEFTLASAGPQFQMLFRLSGDGIMVHEAVSDVSRGGFIQVNDAACRLLGYTPEEMRRLVLLDILAPEYRTTALVDSRTLMDKGMLIHQKTLLAKNGCHIQVEISSRQFEHLGRQLVMSIIRDIAERKKAVEALRGLNAELEKRIMESRETGKILNESRRAALNLTEDAIAARKQAERTRAELENEIAERRRAEEELRRNAGLLATANKELESFSYSVSHDLRAPLRAIKGFSSILMDDYSGKLDVEGRDILTRIIRGADKMSGLVDDMLNLAKISRQEMNPQEIDLSVIADAIINDLRQTEPERKVDVTVVRELTAYADERLMNIALSNLIGNAWKYSSRTPEARIEFGIIEKSGEITYFLKDNGVGFDMTRSSKLFAPFQRLHSDSQFSGTGIGLAIVNKIIQLHGGRIWGEGESGKGAAFYFTLGSGSTKIEGEIDNEG